MSTSQAIYAGWMEIPNSAVNEEARLRAEDAALAALVDQYAGALYRVAYSVLRNPADAEDAVQEAFLRVLRHRETLDEVRDHRVWLIRIVWNIVLDRKRRAKTRPETDDVAELARVLPCERAFGRRDGRAPPSIMPTCWPALSGCPPKSAKCCCFRPLKSLQAWRSPTVLGITESSVRSRLFRARNLMAGLLEHARSLR